MIKYYSSLCPVAVKKADPGPNTPTQVLQHISTNTYMPHGSNLRPQYKLGLKSYLRAFNTEVP